MGKKKESSFHIYFSLSWVRRLCFSWCGGDWPSVNGNDFGTSQPGFLVERCYIFPPTWCPAWGVWLMGPWPPGPQEAAGHTHGPCRILARLLREAQNPAMSRVFRVRNGRLRTQHVLRNVRGFFFFFLSPCILLTFASVLEHNSLRFVFLVYHTGTFIKLWQFQFVWLSSQHQITWTVR